ncbi:MAG TPA: TetR family transcriptional regulator [Asanoa sp.]|nr:TetR family transcriptional regulator [Asanoa sp.]
MARTREFDLDTVVDAAMRVFRTKGYEGASMRDLAEATGLGSGSLYAAFGSKEGLYLASLDRYRQHYATPLVDILRSGSDFREVIRAVFVGVIDDIVTDGQRMACLIVGAAVERAHFDARVVDRLRSTTQSLEMALYDLLAEAQVRGQIPADSSARDLAGFLMTSIQGLRVMGAINSDRAALMRSAEVALSCLG